MVFGTLHWLLDVASYPLVVSAVLSQHCCDHSDNRNKGDMGWMKGEVCVRVCVCVRVDNKQKQ